MTSITKSMTAAATEIIEKFAHLNRVDDVADAAIQEHFQQRAAAQKFILAGAESSGQVSAFDRLGHWVQTPQEEEQWEPRPEMTPRKIQRGWQSSRAVGQDPPPVLKARQDRDSLDPGKNVTPRRAIPKTMEGLTEFRLGSTGQIRVFRSPLPNRIHNTRLSSLTLLKAVTISNPK